MKAASMIELQPRCVAWCALATLFLDTELDDEWLHALARELAATPFSLEQLREILLWEVAPVVFHPLDFSPEWRGFDEAWLTAACKERAGRRRLRLRWAMRLGYRRLVLWHVRRDWLRVETMLAAIRRADGAPAGGAASPVQ